MKAADLRKSILQAAVQGKLVPQNPHDEPATKLLERIRKEKTQLVKEGKIKKEKPLPPISEEEIPFDLPEGWAWCRFYEVANIAANLVSPQNYGAYLHLAPDNIEKFSGKLFDCNTVADDKIKSPNHLFFKGQLIYSKIRPALRKAVIAPFDGLCSADMYPLNVFCKTEFLLLYILSDIFTYQVLANETRVKMPKTNQEELKKVLIPLPPLAEQERIAAKIKDAFVYCEELEAAEKELDTLESQFSEYLPKSILQAAVQGKLVPQNVHDEPADKLLERIKTEKAKLIKTGKLKKEKPLPPITEDEMPYDLPGGWAWCRLGDVCQVNPRNKLADEIHVSFVPMTLISSDFFGGHQQEQRVWGEVKSGFTHFAEDDIVIAKITPCFQNKKSCIVRGLKNGFGAGTTELHVLRPIHILPEYILLYAKSPEFLDDGVKNMTGTAGQQRVPTEFVRSAIIPIPPLAEQQRIVAKVNELMALCEALKAAHETPVGAPIAATVTPFPHQEEEPEMLMAARGAMPKAPSKALQDARNRLFED